MKKERTIILITGMHRSGTSLLGSLMQSIGVSLPGSLLKGDIYNIDGYYEREDIVKLQENILIEMGRWWPTTNGCEEMPSGWHRTKIAKDYKYKLKTLIMEEIDNEDSMWAVKDPRISLLLPVWKEIAAEEEIRLKIVVSIRDPLEVINSLLHRDKDTTGMTIKRAEALWYLHNSVLAKETIGEDSMLIEYTKWFNEKECVKQLNNLYKFCFGVSIPQNLQIKAQENIKYNYRRSNKDVNKIRASIEIDTLKLYAKLRIRAQEKPGEKGDLELLKWLNSELKKKKGKKIKDLWFNRLYYRNQVNRIWNDRILKKHYYLIGWRKSHTPNELFTPNLYKHRAYLCGINVKGCPLTHFSKYGLDKEIEPNSITYYKWIKKTKFRKELFKNANIEGFHPWGAAAIAINNGSQQKGLRTLENWVTNGLNYNDIDEILDSSGKYYDSDILRSENDKYRLPKKFNVKCDTCDTSHWQLYSWIESIYEYTEYSIDVRSPNKLHLLLSSYQEIDCKNLLSLSTEDWVYCRDRITYKLLKRLGVNVKCISINQNDEAIIKKQGYKKETANLGFPDPSNIIKLSNTLVISETDTSSNCFTEPSISILPNPNSINVRTWKEAQAIALWFHECYQLGIQLVWITDSQLDIRTRFWETFLSNRRKEAKPNKPQIFIYPISYEELIEELDWRGKGYNKPIMINPADYSTHNILDIKGKKSAEVTVCISLYNYAHRIINALESVKLQTLEIIDLIIVDDCSSDNSIHIAMDWIKENLSRFNQIKVIGHVHNQGLSTARNTAIKMAQTEWVFILDADNVILPLALESTLKLKSQDNGKVAVVYTIIKAIMEKGENESRQNKLMNFNYWDHNEFIQRNIIDAMTLIKKSAWEEVKGYDNIVGGWEDYDFWCKLIECGYTGIICPQILANYNIHESSMINTMTSKKSRQISRQLQEKHPWLNLPMANEHKVMMEDE